MSKRRLLVTVLTAPIWLIGGGTLCLLFWLAERMEPVPAQCPVCGSENHWTHP